MYRFRKGRIVTITLKHSGNICKILARPGQYVFDNITKDLILLKDNEYIVNTNELRINRYTEYVVSQMNTKPLAGMLVNNIHLVQATVYEKKLRKLGITKSPFYNYEESDGVVNEIIVFNKLVYPYIKPRISSIRKHSFGLYELNNGEVIERGSLKLFYRKPIDYEIKLFKKTKVSSRKELQITI